MKFWWDMDGTIADFYNVKNWLSDLENENTRPYDEAKPLFNMSLFARYLNKIQKEGHKIGIISWCSKAGTKNFNEKVTISKLNWLKKHLPSVSFDYIYIVPYGVNKKEVCGEGYLFDDEERNRKNWGENAYEPADIFNILKKMI